MRHLKTLQFLCIHSIIDNIDVFSAAYRAQNDAFQYYFEFIQRKYSDEILQNLAREKRLRNDHLDFVINKYIKELDFQIFQGCCDYILVADRLKDVGSAIIKMIMSGERNCVTLNNVLSCLPCVEVVELRHTKCSDDTLQIIAESCPNVRSLDLFGCTRVTDKCLEILPNCASLQSLNVEETSVSHRGVAKLLKQMPLLRKLQYENVTHAIFEALGLNGVLKESELDYGQKFSLTNLIIYNNPMRPENHLTQVLRICSQFCPNVTDLLVTDVISKEQLELCSSFENLDIASIGCSFLAENHCINDFICVRGANLHTLRLTSFSLSLELISLSCPRLECLSLETPIFQEVSDAFNVSFPKLKSLNLKRFSADDDYFVALLILASPNIEVLNLYVSVLSEVIYNAIIKSPSPFQVLNFRDSVLDVSFLQEILKTHRSLVKLIIDNTNIDADEYDTLVDVAEELNSETDIVWTNIPEIVRNLFFDIDDVRRQIIKL